MQLQLRSVRSAQRTSVQRAAKVRNPPTTSKCANASSHEDDGKKVNLT